MTPLLWPILAQAQSVYTPYVFTTLAGNSNTGIADGSGLAVGFNRLGPAVLDAAGNAYLCDTGNNTIRKVTPAGVVTTLAGLAGASGADDGVGSAARFSNPVGIARDAAGNLFVSDTSNNTVRKITPAGVVTTFAGLAGAVGVEDGNGSVARFNSPGGLTVDAAGNLYICDTGNNAIRKITPARDVTTVAGVPTLPSAGFLDGTGAAARFDGPTATAVDKAGNVYVADNNNHVIRKITRDGKVTLLAGKAGVRGVADGTGAAARFNRPADVAVDADGNVYVADADSHTLRKITAAGVVTTLAGTAFAGDTTDGTGPEARFNVPSALAVDATGNVFVADTVNNTIRKVTPAGVVTTMAGKNLGSLDGTGTAAGFDSPQGMDIDSAGNLYVADTGNHTIRKITPAGVVTTLAGTADFAGSADGTGAAARFNTPLGVAVDAAGNVFVADSVNRTIRKITSAGVVTTLAGTPGPTGAVDGAGAAARFGEISGLATDSAGNLFVADYSNNTIRLVSPSGAVSTFAGSAGNVGFEDSAVAAKDAHFSSPTGIVIEADGRLAVADRGNNSIRRINLTTGTVTTVAGSGWDRNTPSATGTTNSNLTRDGVGKIARFNAPTGIAADRFGNLFVADSHNHTVRKISAAGVVSTWAGQASVPGMVDGEAAAALFNNPWGIASDADGNLLVGDTYNNSLRRIAAGSTAAGPVSTLAGSGLAGSKGNVEGSGGAARFNEPISVATDALGNLFVTDGFNISIRKITPARQVSTLSIKSGEAELKMIFPTTIAVDRFGYVFYVEPAISAVRVIDPDGKIRIIAGAGKPNSEDNEESLKTKFLTPDGLAIGDDNTLFVADSGYSNIRKVVIARGDANAPTGGEITVFAGGAAAAGSVGSTDAVGVAARFNRPKGLAVSPDRTALFVADTGNNLIRRISIANAEVSTVAGSALNAGASDGVGADAFFNSPTAVAVDSTGAIFVTDSGNSLIRRIDSNGRVTTAGGVGGKIGGANGSGRDALFNAPFGIATGPGDVIYVADTFNNTIRKGVRDTSVATGGEYTFTAAVVPSVGVETAKFGLRTSAIVGSPVVTEPSGPGSVLPPLVWNGTSRLVNLSSRTQIGTGADVTIAGFVVGGTGSKVLLIRGVGPALTSFGVAGNLAAPVLSVFSGDREIANNAGWKSATTEVIRSVAQQVGAFALPEDGRDCALLAEFGAGNYTIHLKDRNGQSGVGLIEIYDATAGSESRLVNLSTRALVGRDSNILITGLVIAGSGPKKVLLRAVGPGLKDFEINNFLSNPKLVLIAGQTPVASNTGWSTSPDRDALAAAAHAAGAFPLASGSADCAMLVTLPPGAYTVHVSGANGETGIALVESYEID